eukprot:1160644-Pelagomonas_calceolata.AAC.8
MVAGPFRSFLRKGSASPGGLQIDAPLQPENSLMKQPGSNPRSIPGTNGERRWQSLQEEC